MLEDESYTLVDIETSAPLDRAGEKSKEDERELSPPPVMKRGTAGRKVLDTVELRHTIFQHLDRDTLTNVIRVEKGLAASVAEILYRQVHVSVITQMKRSSVSFSILAF